MTNIIDSNIVEEYKRDSVRYSIKVNRQRSIPDLRDGLKPVHRRIIDSAFNRVKAINNTVKSAKIVGDVIGTTHPHGDTSVYDAMKPMMNWFEIKIPLLEKQGDFGNIFGDEASASRYTEAKLSEYSLDCIIGDLKEAKNIIDWIPTYDNTNVEPEFFPAMVPNLLINGAFGIGYGIKTDIPSHNIGDVIDATLQLIKDPNSEIVLIPDHCMPVQIIGTNFKSISNKGHGSYIARAIIDIEEYKDRYALVIKSTPDMVFLNNVLEKIDGMIKDKSLLVTNIFDEAKSEDEIRHVLVLKKGVDPNYCRELLYKRTQLQVTCRVNFEVLDRLEPIRMSYKSYLLEFIEFRKLCKFRYYCNKLQDVETKYHEKEAFIKALQSGEINNIISMIQQRTDTNDSELIEYLIKKLDITDLQAGYIINANIKKLSLGYLNKYIEEAQELLAIKEDYMKKIVDEKELLKVIVEELKYFKKKYNKPRTSIVIDKSEVNSVPKGNFRVIFTENNYVKKLPVDFDNGTFKQDSPKFIIKGCNTESILIFDENGKVFRLPIHQIFTSDTNSNGIDIRSIIKNCTSNIVKVIYEPLLMDLSKRTTKYYLTTVTSNGTIKKMDLEDFINIPFSGIIYSKLDSDTVRYVDIYHESIDIVVYSDNKALRFNMKEIPHQKRNTKGMKSISSGDVHGMSFINTDSTEILIITNNGYINRIDAVALPRLERNKPGASVIKLSRGDSINSIIAINKNNSVLKVKTNEDILNIDISSIPSGSSISKGAKIIKGLIMATHVE